MARWLHPGINTKFHIDLDWWKKANRNFRLYLQDSLCSTCRRQYPDENEQGELDWIHPKTGEVKQVDVLWECLLSCCSQAPDYITPTTPLTNAVFRTLLANFNEPLSPVEIHRRIRQSDPQTILRVLTRGEIHFGIVPVQEG